MVEPLTASQERWVALAAQHADDFATRAAQHDRENSFPFENYEAVKATKVPGGFRINGRKAFGTNSPVGDLFGTTAIYDDPAEGEVNLLFIIPKETPGLLCQHDWDTLGMRASASHSWVLDNVFVED